MTIGTITQGWPTPPPGLKGINEGTQERATEEDDIKKRKHLKQMFDKDKDS